VSGRFHNLDDHWIDGDEDEQPTKKAKSRRGRRALAKTTQPHSRVWLNWLENRSLDYWYPAPTRLLLLIVHLTWEGTEEVPITNISAARIGLSRHQKYYHLRKMEGAGLIKVLRKGGRRALAVRLTGGKPPSA
jgi:hypothetical protein